MEKMYIDYLKAQTKKNDTDINDLVGRVESVCVHLASWLAFDAGTRFGKVHADDSAADVWEGLDRLQKINKATGITSAVVWGNQARIKDGKRICEEVKKRGLHIETVHAGFAGESLRYGGATNTQGVERAKAVDEIMSCIELMKQTGARYLSLWFPDGTNYPGQGNFTKRYNWLLDCLREGYAALEDDMIMLIEYKFFEPALYHTDISDWGTAVSLCRELGEKAKVIVDLGHHAQGTNVPAVISSVVRSGKMGAIHFNDSKYADDDLIVGALDPYRLFLIFVEFFVAEKYEKLDVDGIPLMIDQSLIVEKKVPGLLYSVLNIQTAYAKALLVDYDELERLQNENDVIGAAMLLKDAFETDVRPLLAGIRKKNGCPVDPYNI